MESPGVHPRWISQNNLKKKYKLSYQEQQMSDQHALIEFCANGDDTDEILRRTVPGGIKGPTDQWWTWIGGPCGFYGYQLLDQFQGKTLEANQWSHQFASAAADAFELDALFNLRNRMLGYQRGKEFFIRGFEGTPFAILLLLVEGETDRALKLANAAVSATQWFDYQSIYSQFTSNFMFAVLADYLGRPFMKIETRRFSKKAFDPEPYFQQLLSIWKKPDPAEIEEVLVATCDCHTQLAWSGTKFEEREFTNGFWTRVPLVALLIFKLRQLKGLPNPALQHPLAESALGFLQAPNYIQNPVLSTLRKRADQAGLCIAETMSYYSAEVLPPRPGLQ